MEYKKSMKDVKTAIDLVGIRYRSPLITAQSAGVKAKRAFKRLEKIANS